MTHTRAQGVFVPHKTSLQELNYLTNDVRKLHTRGQRALKNVGVAIRRREMVLVIGAPSLFLLDYSITGNYSPYKGRIKPDATATVAFRNVRLVVMI